VLTQAMDFVSEAESKIALIWILGEFGEHIEDAPYILENFLDSIEDSQESLEVKHTLLTASVKLFLRRPPEMQPILGKAF